MTVRGDSEDARKGLELAIARVRNGIPVSYIVGDGIGGLALDNQTGAALYDLLNMTDWLAAELLRLRVADQGEKSRVALQEAERALREAAQRVADAFTAEAEDHNDGEFSLWGKDDLVMAIVNLRAALAFAPAEATEVERALRQAQVTEESGLFSVLTSAVREADQLHQAVGGGTRHWIRECFLPALERHGLAVIALAVAAAPSGPDEQAETGGEQRSPCAGEPNGDGSIVGLLDAIAEFFGDVPDAVKVMKIGEENGEAVEAFIGMTGANVRKGVTHTEGDLRLELADVVITAYVALAAFSGDTWTVLADRVEVIASRLGIGAAPSGEPPSEQAQAPGDGHSPSSGGQQA